MSTHSSDMLKLLIINMVTHITPGDKSRDEELANADEYLDITRTPKSVCMKNLRARRLICRVSDFKIIN